MIRVLVVDDQELVRAGLVTVLETRAGIEVVGEAADGVDAIEQVRLHRPDLVLMDINMPVLDGLETAESLRAHVPPATLRIVALTGCESQMKRERMHAFCDDVLQKPCAPELITSRIQSLIGKSS